MSRLLIARIVAVSLLMFVVSACGWHLRGAVSLPRQLERPMVTGVDETQELIPLVEQRLVEAGGVPVSDAASASLTIELQTVEYRRQTIAVDQEGRPLTYQLIYRLGYRYYQPDLVDKAKSGQVTASINYQYDSNQVLSKSAEEVRVKKQLQDDLALRLLQQLSVRLGANED